LAIELQLPCCTVTSLNMAHVYNAARKRVNVPGVANVTAWLTFKRVNIPKVFNVRAWKVAQSRIHYIGTLLIKPARTDGGHKPQLAG